MEQEKKNTQPAPAELRTLALDTPACCLNLKELGCRKPLLIEVPTAAENARTANIRVTVETLDAQGKITSTHSASIPANQWPRRQEPPADNYWPAFLKALSNGPDLDEYSVIIAPRNHRKGYGALPLEAYPLGETK